MATRYLAFTWYAFNTETRRFRNTMDYQRRWLEVAGSDDSHGRAIWALGAVLGRSTVAALQNMAGRIFEQSLLAILETSSPRAWAFSLVGLHDYLQRFAGDRRAGQARDELGGRLKRLYQENRLDNWRWFENRLTYCNAALSHAMLLCGESTANAEMTAAGLESLAWLWEVQRSDSPDGHFVPVGSNGFYQQGGERARFDQQPVEAQAMVSACLEAYRLTGDNRWRKEARRAFEWFLGRNDLNLPIYDPTHPAAAAGAHRDWLLRPMAGGSKPGATAGGFLYVNMQEVRAGQGEAWEKFFEKYSKPVLEELVAKGVLAGWAVHYEDVHTAPNSMRFVVTVSNSPEAEDQADAAFGAARAKLSDAERSEYMRPRAS